MAVGGERDIKIWWARESTGWDFSWWGWNEQIFGYQEGETPIIPQQENHVFCMYTKFFEKVIMPFSVSLSVYKAKTA